MVNDKRFSVSTFLYFENNCSASHDVIEANLKAIRCRHVAVLIILIILLVNSMRFFLLLLLFSNKELHMFAAADTLFLKC